MYPGFQWFSGLLDPFWTQLFGVPPKLDHLTRQDDKLRRLHEKNISEKCSANPSARRTQLKLSSSREGLLPYFGMAIYNILL